MKKLQAPFAAFLLMITAFASCSKEISEEIVTEPQPEFATMSTTSAPTLKYIKVNLFGGSNAYSSTEWNNWNTSASLSSSTLKYSDGSVSTVSATLSQQTAISDNGSSYTATMAPSQIVRYASYSTSNRALTISGLDNAKSYDLSFYASRNGASNNTTRFVSGGKTVDVKTDNNKTNIGELTSLVPASGKITVNISKLNSYNYVNGFQITERTEGIVESTPPPPPPPTPEPLPEPLPVISGNCNSATPKVYTLTANNSGEIYIPNGSTRGWKGGDTLKIPAGNYTLIHIGNFKGDECRPIVIINTGGQVVAQHMRFVNDAAYFKLTGTGSSHNYGFKISSSKNAGIATDLAHHVEINNVEITGVEVGLYFKKNPTSSDPLSQYPNYTLSNYYIHHNYIHDVHGEGMYIGDTYPNSDPYNGNLTPIRMDKIEIAYNIVDGTDWDGIQLSNARSGAKIHHNTVTNFGRINKSSQQAGIILGGNTSGDIYDNVVKNGTGNGIQAFGYGLIKIYNNTVENVGIDGTANGQESVFCNDPINLVESNPKQEIRFYNNIIKNPKPKGGIRVGAYNHNSLPSTITGNTVYLPNALANWLTFYMVSHVAGSNISGNTVIK